MTDLEEDLPAEIGKLANLQTLKLQVLLRVPE